MPVRTRSQRRRVNGSDSSSSTKNGTASSSMKNGGGGDHAFHYEFGGPPGALGTMVALPVVVYGLYFLCRGSCQSADGFCVTPSNYEQIPEQIPTSMTDLWDLSVAGYVVGWIAFQILLERVLPGPRVPGVQLSNGTRLIYPLNGHLAFWISIAAAAYFLPLGILYDRFVYFASGSLVLAMGLSAYLYARSFASGALLAPHGDSGNPVYDFFIGRELNPRVGSFDLKYFFELRPGLIGWVLVNLGCAMKQYELKGEVSGALILVNVFQGLYVWDALYNERAILTTMDIINDGFGFMLAFGDITWVPFTYSLQARYLVENDGAQGLALVAICALNVLGYWIFRGSNGQKDTFRRDPADPSVAHLETISTKRGRKLLVSGWWGMARKINYTGDWLMGLSWCLFTGFDSIVPYFYAIYFAILLIHRALRDDDQCTRKYGEDWPRYKAKVPYVFIPGVL